MDADERTANRIANVVVGLIGLGALWLLAQFVPAFVAAVLMTGSFLVLLLALIGFIKPSWARLPNRLAGVWLIAMSVGMFVGGGVLLNQGEDEISTANGALTVNPDGSTSSAVAPGSQAQGDVLPHERPSADLTTPAPMAPELAHAEAQREAQRVVDENARRRREARGLAVPRSAERRESPTAGGTGMIRTGDNQAFVMNTTWRNGPWPFTVDAGNIGCVTIDAGPVLVFADTNGVVWPLNGLAIAHGPRVGGQPSLNPIWRRNPQIPGTRIPLGPMMDAASSLC